MTTAALALNIPGNPVAELRHYQSGGIILAHAGMVLLAVGLRPAVSRALLAAVAKDSPRLALQLVAGVVGVAAAMLMLGAAWPDYAHQLLTREWGLIEPLQFVLYVLAATLSFRVAERSPRRTSQRRLYRLGGWLAVVFAFEEIDYVGALASLVRLAGVERARIGRAYLGGVHDIFNVAAQYGMSWLPWLVLATGLAGAVWWISGGRVVPAREIVSWRVVPALVAVAFMAVAQLNDVYGHAFAARLESRLLNDFLEEPLELLAILCVKVTLVLELAHHARQELVRVP